MAYDPKDPADKKIVDGLIADAIAEKQTEHETEIQGLKDKRTELLGTIAKLKKGEGVTDNSAEIEAKLEETQAKLVKAEKDLKKAQGDAATFKEQAETESSVTRKLLVDNGLTAELTAVKVASEYQPAVKALLAGKVELKTVGDERKAFVGDKPLGEFVKEWSQGDEGKHYVAAANNSGGGANGGKANEGGKSANRTAFDGMSSEAKMAFVKDGGTIVDD